MPAGATRPYQLSEFTAGYPASPVVGTSAIVHPAASLVPIAKRSRSPGATIIEVNLAPTEASSLADIGLYGPSGQVLPRLVERLP